MKKAFCSQYGTTASSKWSKVNTKKAMRNFSPAYEELGGRKQELLDCINGQPLLLAGRGELAQS